MPDLDPAAVADLARRLANLAIPVLSTTDAGGDPAANAILGTARILEALVRAETNPGHAAEHAEDAAVRTGTLLRDVCAVWADHVTGPVADIIAARIDNAHEDGDPLAESLTLTIPEDDPGPHDDPSGLPTGEARVDLGTGTMSTADGALSALPAGDALAVHIATHTAAGAAAAHLYGPAR